MEEFGEKMQKMSNPEAMQTETAIQLNLGVLLFSAIISPFMAGFLKMANCGEKGEEFHVSTMFSYYKLPYFFNIFISVFVIGLLSTGLALLFQTAGLSFIGTLTNLLISFFTFLTIPLIVFGDLNATEAIKSGIIIVSKQPLVLLGLLIEPLLLVCLEFLGFVLEYFSHCHSCIR